MPTSVAPARRNARQGVDRPPTGQEVIDDQHSVVGAQNSGETISSTSPFRVAGAESTKTGSRMVIGLCLRA
jgi:hypothetical protein